MTNTAAIATKLNVLESAIVRVEEWANVLFCVVKGLGARFVSKKVVEVKKLNLADCIVKKYSATEVQTIHFTTGAYVIAKIGTGEITSEYRGKERVLPEELRQYAKTQAVEYKPEPRVAAPVKKASVNLSYHRTSCRNCDRTNTVLTRGLCTDCYGEC
jgi:hypothetical protein